MNKKYLVASGCSWTDHYFTSDYHRDLDTSWDKWPTILANKLDMEVINLGSMGSGNEGIYSRVSDFISETPKEKIGLIIVAWSGAARRDWELIGHRKKWARGVLNSSDSIYKKYITSWVSEIVDSKGDSYYFMRRSIRNFYALQVLCERYNIPYKQICALDPIGAYQYTKFSFDTHHIDVMNHFFTSSQFEEINKDNFIGWPIFEYMGGFCLNDILKQNRPKYAISLEDLHPNALGQQLIADIIYENL
jgi:hypothetical protein